MSYFTTSKVFLVPSFTLEAKETEIFDRYLAFLEKSGVGRIISEGIRSNTKNGGRPTCDYYRLFATILYGFAFDRYTLRQIEIACRYDLRYLTLMNYEQVDHTTISRFINKIMLPKIDEIFAMLCKQIQSELGIDFDVAFIDGTKFEANANKYKFVWKPITYHKKLTATLFHLMSEYGIKLDAKPDELLTTSTIAEAITKLERKRGVIDGKELDSAGNALVSILEKLLEYEEKEEICGPDRNSYYKTDHDATTMCLKADYYSGQGTNMHAAYNVQALVIQGFVFAYQVSNARTDYSQFIPVLESFHKNYGVYPKNVCADAGYGILKNYRYLNENGIGNYVKYQSWEGNANGNYPDCFTMNDDGTITCLGGKIGTEVSLDNRHPRNASAVFFRVEGCNSCPFRSFCKKFMKNHDEDFKIFEVVKEQEFFKKQATKNLLSKDGIQNRVNRSIQVEGVFGIIKQDYERERLLRRGMDKVRLEIALKFLGLNIAKLFRFYETGKLNKFWVAPDDLKPEEFKKPSAKRLAKKGDKINKRQQERLKQKEKDTKKMTDETKKIESNKKETVAPN